MMTMLLLEVHLLLTARTRMTCLGKKEVHKDKSQQTSEEQGIMHVPPGEVMSSDSASSTASDSSSASVSTSASASASASPSSPVGAQDVSDDGTPSSPTMTPVSTAPYQWMFRKDNAAGPGTVVARSYRVNDGW